MGRQATVAVFMAFLCWQVHGKAQETQECEEIFQAAVKKFRQSQQVNKRRRIHFSQILACFVAQRVTCKGFCKPAEANRWKKKRRE